MRRKFRVDITASAERDARAIKEYIARDKPAAAEKWARAWVRQVRGLAALPLRHEIIPEALELGEELRHVLFGNYRTIYRIQEQNVIVLRVVHSAQLLDAAMLSGP